MEQLKKLKRIDELLDVANFNDYGTWNKDHVTGACFKHVWKANSDSNLIFTVSLKNEKVGIIARKYLYISLNETKQNNLKSLNNNWEIHSWQGNKYAHLRNTRKVPVEDFLQVLLQV